MSNEQSSLQLSDMLWEYEDRLPKMSNDEFRAVFLSSRVDVVRVYPYVKDSAGNRIWITNLKEP
jgi:hypothetical protein